MPARNKLKWPKQGASYLPGRHAADYAKIDYANRYFALQWSGQGGGMIRALAARPGMKQAEGS